MKSAHKVLVQLLVAVFAFLPFWLLYLLSDVLFLLMFHLFRYRRPVVRQNLVNSFPDKTSAEINRLANKYYRHLCDLLVEGIKGLSLSQAQLEKRFVYRNPDIFPSDQSALILGSHFRVNVLSGTWIMVE